jgi:aminoglycoside 2'-N-acetyltransferase I
VTSLRIAHTADLEPATLAAVRSFLFDVFDDLTADDWEHSLGGMHTIVSGGDQVIGHAAVVQRRLWHGARALRTGYVEGVAVRADRRRQGHASAMMDAIERVIRGAYDVGALAATDEAAAFYAGRGWRLWRGATAAFTPAGTVRTPDDDDCVFVFPVTIDLDLTGDLTCDWRDGDLW